MAQSIVSTKYQVVIPREIRRTIEITPGQIMQVLAKGNVITLVPLRSIKTLRGFVKGMPVKAIRDKEDRY